MKYLLLTSVLLLSSCGYVTQEQEDSEKMSVYCELPDGKVILDQDSIHGLGLTYKNTNGNPYHRYFGYGSYTNQDGIINHSNGKLELPEEMTCTFKVYKPNQE